MENRSPGGILLFDTELSLEGSDLAAQRFADTRMTLPSPSLLVIGERLRCAVELHHHVTDFLEDFRLAGQLPLGLGRAQIRDSFFFIPGTCDLFIFVRAFWDIVVSELTLEQGLENSNRIRIRPSGLRSLKQRHARWVATREVDDRMAEELDFPLRVGGFGGGLDTGFVEIELVGRGSRDRSRSRKKIQFLTAQVRMSVPS